ncbi:SFH5-phospholipid transporter [Fusarium subglutinans]|uniref:Phosphatidylinositol transfer protein SFH5 n=1 Tax=Gibberella subglutinans TaxID=42677 RepID=A0A8H5PIJ4_GIBSU|nr:SFH5-phospholipid transporter [Fusarium subglutinans]KAF5596978.1 SFH5-phospholipid transporter [Fusarium subglutinans]
MAAEQDKTVPAAVPAENPATPETPLTKLNARLEDIFTKTLHKEMWGVQLTNIDHVPTKVVLQKFLRANNDDPVAAEKQLTQALEWRKKMNPTALVTQTFDKSKFGDLGYVTVHKGENGKETIITWNIYGAVKDNKATFGNVEEFIKWRAAIMELSVQKLKLDQVTEPIPEGGEDPYQMIQVHDYLNVSFFRMDPAVKAASKETISVFSMAYPELLAHKYFVNVPAIMGWMFGAMKLFLAPATLRKFHPMTSGTTLAIELKGIVSTLPKEYGGQGPSVKEGMSVSVTETGETKAEPSPTGVPEQTAATDSTTAEKNAVAPESAPATEKPLTAEPAVAAAAPAPAPALAAEAVPAPIPAPVEAAKAETAEQAAEQAGEKPIEEALEKLSVDPAESEKKDTLATDVEKKETAA